MCLAREGSGASNQSGSKDFSVGVLSQLVLHACPILGAEISDGRFGAFCLGVQVCTEAPNDGSRVHFNADCDFHKGALVMKNRVRDLCVMLVMVRREDGVFEPP